MVYRRAGRPSHYFQAKTETGWKQVCTLAREKKLATRIEAMWEELASTHRAWNILERVLDGRMAITALYDQWSATKGDVAEIRRRFQDVDLVALVPDWQKAYARDVAADTATLALAHVRTLLPEETRRMASTVTPSWLTEQLSNHRGKRNTRRKVHSSWSMFFDWCTRVKGLYTTNPMDKVDRPRLEESPLRFYELPVAQQIVEAQPSAARKALMALFYGSGIEVSTALRLNRTDLNPATREVRAAGTKAHSRDRVAMVAEWAWPLVWRHARTVLPNASLWPATWNRWTVSDWHRETVEALNLQHAHPLHCARHHWAVRQLRAGAPVAVVQAQLGHGSPTLTLKVYGRFMPSGVDRSKWEREASKYDAARHSANRSANA